MSFSPLCSPHVPRVKSHPIPLRSAQNEYFQLSSTHLSLQPFPLSKRAPIDCVLSREVPPPTLTPEAGADHQPHFSPLSNFVFLFFLYNYSLHFHPVLRIEDGYFEHTRNGFSFPIPIFISQNPNANHHAVIIADETFLSVARARWRWQLSCGSPAALAKPLLTAFWCKQ